MARVVAAVPGPAMFVLDYEGNCTDPARLRQTLPEFVRILRQAHPATPLLVVSGIAFAADALQPGQAELRRELRDIQADAVSQIRAAGDGNIHFLNAGDALGADFDECTVDGVHPTDLGFMRMAGAFEPAYRRILGLPGAG